MKRRYVLEGRAFSTLQEFAAHFSEVVLDGHVWNGNLDAFNDILRGGFGTPDGGFVLVWKDHGISRKCLGHGETARRLRRLLKTCHPTGLANIEDRLEAAQKGHGPTLFDELRAIIEEHGPGGAESSDGVALELL